jgi:hypothetical protein
MSEDDAYMHWIKVQFLVILKCRLVQVLVQKRFGHTIIRYLILHLSILLELKLGLVLS